jgi:WD40 repeat protein
VVVSFDAWKEGQVAPAHQEIDIVAAASNPKREALSPRLKAELIHPHKQSSLGGLRFSPDGRRLLASASPSGIVSIWEVETGKVLATIETGPVETGRGNAARTTPFHLSPACTRLYARKGPAVGVWDTETGRLIDTLQPESRRGVRSMIVSPDGKALITVDSGRDAAGYLWDLAAKQPRPLPKNLDVASGAFSRDGKFFAAPIPRDEFYSRAIQVIDVATLRVRTEIAISQPYARAYVTDFTPDGKLLRGAVEVYAEQLWQKWEQWRYATKFWDAASGKEVASFAADESETSYSLLQYSADGNTLAATRWTPRKGTRAEKLHANLRSGAKLYLLDVRDKQLRSIVLQDHAVVRAIAFRPDGKWVAAATQGGGRAAFTDFEGLPQPRIHLVEVSTAQVRDTLVAPPGSCAALAFSPDGKTLASAGVGKVFLWNLNRLRKE